VDFNRNHYFIAGLVLVMLGIQLRFVQSFVLSSETTTFLATKLPTAKTGSANLARATGAPRRTVSPPEWAGWAFLSIGAVLILHSLAMPRPEG
jgi:hypothetical protein